MKIEFIKYCKKCVMPSTKPDFKIFDDGLCVACKAYDLRKKINWKKRENEFLKIIKKYKKFSNANYDCIIPCSGGKDSTYQTLKVLEHGMNPLCVTATTDMLSDIGRYNIENIKKLGVDYIEVSTDPVLRRKINLFTLENVGDISWAEHLTIFTIPVRVSVLMKIPLIIWGENPQNENGGPEYMLNNKILNRRWLEEFGGLLGLRVTDISDLMKIPKNKLLQYTYPTDNQIKNSGTTGIFLGHYFEWDGYSNAEIAKKNGFKSYGKPLEGSIVDFENLDNLQMRIHDYFKFLKFGYDRVTDWCCWHIRRGRLKRKDAINLVKNKSGKYPYQYMGIKLENILKEISCSKNKFDQICENFTNKNLFKIDKYGKLQKDSQRNLIKINYDNIN
jgi:N-acetyl sugar amidotransferase